MDIRDIKFLRGIVYLRKKYQWKKMNTTIEKLAESRVCSKNYGPYSKLKAYENVYNGERCFIVATGPSLTLDDLELIKGEYSFSMNSICKLFEKTSWRPTFYGIQDLNVYDKLEKDIKQANINNILVSDILAQSKNIPEDSIIYPLNPYYHNYDAEIGKYYACFSDNAIRMVYDGYSISYSLLQIAIYMGFKEIYLLGVDCDYNQQKKHIVESGHIDRRDFLNNKKMTKAFEAAKRYINNHDDIHIINCSRGGMLEVFPRKTLESVLL